MRLNQVFRRNMVAVVWIVRGELCAVDELLDLDKLVDDSPLVEDGAIGADKTSDASFAMERHRKIVRVDGQWLVNELSLAIFDNMDAGGKVTSLARGTKNGCAQGTLETERTLIGNLGTSRGRHVEDVIEPP